MWNPENPVKGIYRLKSGAEIGFTLQGGELLFSKSGQSITLDQMKLSPIDQLNLISRALYAQAQNGYDPDSGVKSAAAHVVRDYSNSKDGELRVFVASNANSRSRQQRPHAEVNALVLAKNAIKNQDFKVEKTYLTLFDPNGQNKFPATPCGHCREDLTDTNFVDPDAELYCLPSYNPTKITDKLPLITICDQYSKEHPDITKTQSGQAFKMKMMNLARTSVPINVTAREDIDYWKDQMLQGIEYVKKPDNKIPFYPVIIDDATRDEMIKLAQTGNTGRLLYLEGEQGTLPRINQQLANMIKTACNQHHDKLDDLHKVRATLAVRANGEVYGGTYVDIKPQSDQSKTKAHSAKPQAEVMALGNALNAKDIVTIYTMEMDERYIARSLKEEGAPELKMPYTEALDGIMKSSHSPHIEPRLSPDNVVAGAKHSRCMIHTIALNNGVVLEEKIKQGMVSMPIEKLLIAPFQAPTMHHARASAESVKAPVTGCC